MGGRRTAAARCTVWLCVAALAACRSAPPPSADPTEAYLGRLIRGDTAALQAGFADEPAVDDPMGGRVRGRPALWRFVDERHQWLTARNAHAEVLRTVRDSQRTVVEAVLHLRVRDTTIDLPVGVVGDRAPGGGRQLLGIRVYHSHWPLEGAHRIRAPLLRPDTTIRLHDIVAAYQRDLAAGDAKHIVSTFEPNGYFREPSGGMYEHRGTEALREFMTSILSGGGIRLQHCTLTDDGVAAALEFNVVQIGSHRLTPQAGLAVYERGPSGHLHAARIYDDVNVESFAK